MGPELMSNTLAWLSMQQLIRGIHGWNLARSWRKVARPLVAALQFSPFRCWDVFFTLNRTQRSLESAATAPAASARSSCRIDFHVIWNSILLP